MHDQCTWNQSLCHDIKLLARIDCEAHLLKDLVKNNKSDGKSITSKILRISTCLLKEHCTLRWNCATFFYFSEIRVEIVLIAKRDLEIDYPTENSTEFIENSLRLVFRDLKKEMNRHSNKLCGHSVNF